MRSIGVLGSRVLPCEVSVRLRSPICMAAPILLLSGASVLVAPSAAADLAADTAAVTLSVDGFGVGISSSVTEWDGSGYVSRSGRTFGNGTLADYFGSKSGANTYFLAHGGFVTKTGGTCASGGTVYERARVTVSGLASGSKDVWAFWDGGVGTGDGSGSSQWEDAGFSHPTVSGTVSSGATSLTVSSGSGIAVGQYVYGTNIAGGTKVSAVSGSTVTLSSATSGSLSNGATVYFGKRLATTASLASSSLATLCDGSTRFVENVSGNGGSASEAVLDLGTSPSTGVYFNDAAGLKVAGTSATTISFDVYVPTSAPGVADNAQTSQWKFLSLGFVIDAGTRGTLSASEDFGIQTQVYARSFFENGSTISMLTTCSGTPAAGDAPCIDGASDNGVFLPDGVTRVGASSVQLVEMEAGQVVGGQPVLQAASYGMRVGLTAGPTTQKGFEIPANSVVKIKLSLPTVLNVNGFHPTVDFSKATGQTTLKVDPASSSDSYSLATAGGRTTYSVVGIARSTSKAVSRKTWSDACSITIAGSNVSTSGCQADSDSMVVDTVPVEFNLGWQNDTVMQSVGGGYVSTNAQAMQIGDETIAGTSFQFAVAGPSQKQDGSNRDTDGFYYVCVPETFLDGSFHTTAAAASSTWQGTRDGQVLSSGVSFTTGTCGRAGIAGLVASYPVYHYSSPLFSVRPPTSAGGGSASGSGGSSSSDSSPATTVPAVLTPPTAAAPVPAQGAAAAPSAVLPSRPQDLRPSQVAHLTSTMLQSLAPSDVARISPSVLGALESWQVQQLPARAFGALSASQVGAMRPSQVRAIPAASLSQVRAVALSGLNPADVRAIPLSTLRDVTPSAARRLLSITRGLSAAQRQVLLRDLQAAG